MRNVTSLKFKIFISPHRGIVKQRTQFISGGKKVRISCTSTTIL